MAQPPPPNVDHQDLEGALEAYLRVRWTPGSGGKVYHQIALTPIGGWPHDYRVPDLVLLLPQRFAIDRRLRIRRLALGQKCFDQDCGCEQLRCKHDDRASKP